MDMNQVGIKAKNICKDNSPKDTLALINSIKKRKKKNGVTITFPSSMLNYIEYQNEGFRHYITKQRVLKNRGFIDKSVVDIIRMIYVENGLSKNEAKRQTEKDIKEFQRLNHYGFKKKF